MNYVTEVLLPLLLQTDTNPYLSAGFKHDVPIKNWLDVSDRKHVKLHLMPETQELLILCSEVIK